EGNEINELLDPDGTGITALENGYSMVVTVPADWVGLSLNWEGGGGESVIARWDPSGVFGPLGPVSPSGGTPGVPFVPRTVPPAPTPTTNWNATTDSVYADFTLSPAGPYYPGDAIQFTNTSSGPITHLSWHFGDGSPDESLENPVHAFNRNGTYLVSLTVWNLATGASDTVVKTVEVLPGAVWTDPLSFDVTPTVGRRELLVTCSDPTHLGQTIWRWTFTDGLTGATYNTTNLTESMGGRSQTYTFSNPSGAVNNTCRIDLTVWSPYVEGPIVFPSRTVVVAPPLQADFTSNVTLGVSPCAVQFVDTSVGLPETWSWDFGDGTTSTEQHPVHVYTVGPNEVRNYTVRLTVTTSDPAPAGQTSTIAREIAIYPPVVAGFWANVTEGEAPLTVQFMDQSTGFANAWRWNFGDNTSSTEQNPVHTFTEEGTYDVTLYAERTTDPHSADEKTIDIYIHVGPPVTTDFSASPTIGAAPLSVRFTDASTSEAPIVRWSWDFESDGTIDSTEQNPLHTYEAPGTYNVTLTAGNAYRQSSVTKTNLVTVVPGVVASFSANSTTIPVNGTVAFTDESTGSPTGWSWDFGDGNTSTERHPTHTYASTGTFSVSLTASNDYSSNTSTRVGYITVYEEVIADFSANQTEGLAPLTVQFTNASTGDPTSFSWDFDSDGTEDSDEQDPVYTYSSAGTYSVTLTARNAHFTSVPVTKTAYIRVFDPVAASFTADQTVGPVPLTVQFTDTSTGDPTSYAWDFGDGATSIERNPVHTFGTPGTFN
ncbi:MAG TPA: PKD domain-containing protein, partial [Methanoregulaceae archaeon]|nr:PKD domain-containing protein [Methanoregulaceae archaeon]